VFDPDTRPSDSDAAPGRVVRVTSESVTAVTCAYVVPVQVASESQTRAKTITGGTVRITIRVRSMTLNGTPAGCPQCATRAVHFTASGPVAGWPARGWCTVCSHNWEDDVVTVEAVRLIATTSTGREKATDRDLFDVQLAGRRLAGELVPEATVDDVRQVWKRGLKPLLKREVRKAKRKAKTRTKKAVVGGVKKVVAVPTAAALTADWTTRAGGFEDIEIDNPCPAGCDRGYFELDTAIHDGPRVKCSLCDGTGECDA
jgi:hypothetical protein